MGLFVCSKCKAVENTACCWNSKLEVNFDFYGKEEDYFPNMGLMDMQGFGDAFYLNGLLWKDKKEVKMLCSECNSGTWHGEWEKKYATVEEEVLSTYNKFRYITNIKDNESAVLDKLNGHGLDWAYHTLHTIYRNETGKTTLDKIMDGEIIPFKLFYIAIKENPQNFSSYSINSLNLRITDVNTLEEFIGILDRCMVDVDNEKQTAVRFLKYLYKTNPSSNIEDAFDMIKMLGTLDKYKKEYKNGNGIDLETLQKTMMSLSGGKSLGMGNWKSRQSPEDKEARIKAAELKRQRKAERRG